MKKILHLLCTFLMCTPLVAQESFKWGEPTKKEIDLKICPFDSAANAIILAENAHVSFTAGFFHVKIYKKIKILNSNGLEHATVDIPYYAYDDLDDVTGLKAHTINIEQGVLKEIDLGKTEVFTKVLTPTWREKSFTFPGAQAGSILEYKYTLVTQRREFMDSWAFQHPIPTIYSEIKTEIPTFFNYATFLSGTELKEKYLGKENKKSIWSLSNLPGYGNEPYVSCYADYINKVKFQWLSSTSVVDGNINAGNGWEKFTEEVRENHKSYIGKKGLARDILKEIIDERDSREEKIRKIYSYVYPMVPEYSYYEVNKEIQQLLKSKTGNSAEINLFLCLLLKQAGITAYPVLISTRDNGSITKSYPVTNQFNHVIVAIEEKGSFKYTDAVSPSENCYLLPYNDINYSGYLLNDSTTKWVTINFPVESKENISVKYRIGTSDISLQLNETYSGYYATEKRKAYLKEDKREVPQFFLGDIILENDSSSNKNLKDPYQDYSETHYYSAPYSPGGKIYLSLNLYGDENPFKQKDRLFPLELPYPYTKQYSYNIQLPAGDTIKTLPKNLTLLLQDEGTDYGKFSYKVLHRENTLTVTTRIDMLKTVIPVDYYEHLKDFFNRIIAKMNEPIIIEKK